MPRVKTPRRSPARSPDESPGGSPEEAAVGKRVTMFDPSGDSRVRVNRRDDKTMKYIFHGYVPADATEEDLSRLFGGGHYRCQKLVKDSQGSDIIDSQREFDVPGAYRPQTGELPGVEKQPALAATASSAAAGGAHPSGGDNPMSIIQADLARSYLEVGKAARELMREPADNVMKEVLAEMREDRRLLVSLIEKIGKPQDGGRKELLAELEVMRRLVAPATPTSGSKETLTELVDAIKQLRDVSEEFNPPTKAPENPLDLVPKVLEVISEEQKLRRGAQQPRALAVVRPETPMLTPEQPAAAPVPLWQRIIQKEGPKLIAAAQANRDPELVASVAYQFAPDQIKGALSEFFNGPTDEVVAKLREQLPPLNEFASWTEEFVIAAQIEIFGEPEEPEEEEPEQPKKPA